MEKISECAHADNVPGTQLQVSIVLLSSDAAVCGDCLAGGRVLLSDILVSTLFHDVDGRLITGHCPSHDVVVLITRKMLELQSV